jgi:hypothetical protein
MGSATDLAEVLREAHRPWWGIKADADENALRIAAKARKEPANGGIEVLHQKRKRGKGVSPLPFI